MALPYTYVFFNGVTVHFGVRDAISSVMFYIISKILDLCFSNSLRF